MQYRHPQETIGIRFEGFEAEVLLDKKDSTHYEFLGDVSYYMVTPANRAETSETRKKSFYQMCQAVTQRHD